MSDYAIHLALLAALIIAVVLDHFQAGLRK